MGRLISKLEFRGGPNDRHQTGDSDKRIYNAIWYFADTTHAKIQDSYPFRLSIHVDHLSGVSFRGPSKLEAGANRIAIRKLIERRMEGDVVYDIEYLTHVRVYPISGQDKKRYSTTITHGYYHFYFEEKTEAIFFTMHFGELISTPTEYHPDYKPADGYEDFHGPDAHMRARELTGYFSLF